jgi:hypothetical protein
MVVASKRPLVEWPMFFETTTERYEDIQVREHDSEPRGVYMLEAPRPSVGELWDIRFELHVTNEGPRAKGYGVAATTEVRLQATKDNDRSGGVSLLRANGSWNVGVEAHHALISRSKIIKWDEEKIGEIEDDAPLFLKVFLMAKSTQAVAEDRLIIDQGKGFLQLLRSALGELQA